MWKKHLTFKCRLCAIRKVLDMVMSMEDTHKRADGTAKWTVEAMNGHLNGWEVVANDKDRLSPWIYRHGH